MEKAIFVVKVYNFDNHKKGDDIQKPKIMQIIWGYRWAKLLEVKKYSLKALLQQMGF